MLSGRLTPRSVLKLLYAFSKVKVLLLCLLAALYSCLEKLAVIVSRGSLTSRVEQFSEMGNDNSVACTRLEEAACSAASTLAKRQRPTLPSWTLVRVRESVCRLRR